MKKTTALYLLFIITCAAYSADVDNWPAWRGPDFNGVCNGKGFPVNWSKTENIKWKIPLPEGSGSTPIVWEDYIFVTCTREGKNILFCFDHAGNKRWEQTLGDARRSKHRRKGSGAHPSPTTDGKYVYVYYKSGDLTCLSFDGKIIWHKNLQEMFGKDTLWWDLGTSPVLTKEFVVVATLHDKPSYIVAFDKLTGQVAWKQDRNMNAPREANQSYTTPVVLSENGNETIYVLGADHVTAHNAQTGKELWRVGGFNPNNQQFFRSIASPVISDDILIAPYARGNTLTAIRTGGSGDVTDTHVLWKKEGLSSDIPTPAAINGKVYLCTDRGLFACLDIKTGEVLWSGKVSDKNVTISPSPIVVDGRIYVTSETGTTFVLKQGNEFKLMATNEIGEFILATPVFTKNHILIRTFENLYCIGK